MEKNELIEYLKDNLRIGSDIDYGYYDGSSATIKIFLRLEDEEIAATELYISLQ